MKKICFVTTLSITIKAFLLDFKEYLLENSDYDITFICNDDEYMHSICSERVHFVPIKMKRGTGFDGLGAINKMIKIFKEEQFDIIQYSTPNASLYASIAAKIAGCKARLYCQWGIRYMGFGRGIKREIFKIIEKITCRSSSAIECESKSIYEFGVKEKLYPVEKASVIWNGSACGVNLKKYNMIMKNKWKEEIRKELQIEQDAFVFGYAGRITKDKGANELLLAFKKVLENKNIYLLIVGEFDDEESIEKSLRKWAINCPNIIFVKWTEQVEKYYSAMDVFCSLSYREGFGLVVIEAAAMGLPSIVSNVPGQVDTITPNFNGWLIPVKDHESVTKIMEHCIENINEVNEYAKNARKEVEEKYEQNKLFEYLACHRNEICSLK